MPHEFLIDRDLGKRVVAGLRDGGYLLHTLPELFGEAGAMAASDEEWMAKAAEHGWATLSKNHRISHIPKERDTLMRLGVPLFAPANGSLDAAEMISAYLSARDEITRILDTRPGGGVWAVGKDGKVRHRWPPQERVRPVAPPAPGG